MGKFPKKTEYLLLGNILYTFVISMVEKIPSPFGAGSGEGEGAPYQEEQILD